MDWKFDSLVFVRPYVEMREIGWSLCFFIALGLALVLAEETDDLNTVDQPVNNKEKEVSRSGAPDSNESTEPVANSETEHLRESFDDEQAKTDETKRNFKGGDLVLDSPNYLAGGQSYDQLTPLDAVFPYKNDYKYDPKNVQNANQVLTYNGASDAGNISPNQVLVSGSQNLGLQFQRSGKDAPESYSRLIPYNEHIFPHKIPGANHLVSCSREGELHNAWSSTHQCLVCACIKDDGVLRAVCASCAGCMAPKPEIMEYPEQNTPGRPYLPESHVTVPVPQLEEEVTCKPLPTGKPFDNPLHPCQVCICIESVNVYGKPDVHIQCQENPQCVLPTDVTVIPFIPDVPVTSPYCDKFPLNVLFPHPSDACKTCRCTEQLAQGLLEKQLTCLPNPDCITEAEIITESATPSYLIPVEPNLLEPVPEIIPTYEIDTHKPSWTPATVSPAHLTPPGPLPGPSPHDSCKPYIPNQPFQHPWDECQMCICTEAFAKKHVTVEISCFTKKSCCIEPPFDVVIPATLPPAPYKQPGKLQFQDAICEYKTFGVEFAHPKDPCNICTCELQGHLITPLCKRSPKPECQLIIYPTVPVSLSDVIQGTSRLPPSSFNSYNAGSSSSSSHNKAMKNAFVSYQNPYGSSGLQMGSTQSSADQSSYNQWNLQKYQRPGEPGFSPQNVQSQFGPQNFRPDSLGYGQNPRPGNSQFYGPQYNNVQNLGYPGQGYQGGAYGQNYYPGSGPANAYAQAYPGNQLGLLRPGQISQAQAKASASASVSSTAGQSYGYAPGYPYPGNQVNTGGKVVQFAQSSASSLSQAQSSSQSASKIQGRSGDSDDNISAEKEN